MMNFRKTFFFIFIFIKNAGGWGQGFVTGVDEQYEYSNYLQVYA